MAKLLIVESPGKIKTLRKILGHSWTIEASLGHTTELASDGPRRLGFELKEDQVSTRYVPRTGRGRQTLAKLRKAAKGAERVYLATDPDREGEAIAWHLVRELRLKNFVRVTYTQITDAAVKQAIARPAALNMSLVESQRARQCLDKLVGFDVSPLLWRSTGGKSAGRVQSATLHMICERERERLVFVSENYWVLHSRYREGFEAMYERKLGEATPARSDQPPSNRVRTEAEAKLIAEVARTGSHRVSHVDRREEARFPPPPLITSSLQQAAGAKLRMSPKRTMQIAQELYEGVGGKGLITYMRTDSVSLSPEFISEARHWLASHAPDALSPHLPRFREREGSQAAHEAIRPTQASLTPSQASESLGLSEEQSALYRLIWERTMGSFCKPASLAKTEITIECADTLWLARGSIVVDPGYLVFWNNLENDRALPDVQAGQILGFSDVKVEAKKTEPPPRYSEPKLIQLMEKKGIGRPSTYASTIATLKERDYVALEERVLKPTALGMATDTALSKALPELVDAAFTAQMENSLDEIAEGRLEWERFLTSWNRDTWGPSLLKARDAFKGVKKVANPRFSRRPRRGKATSPKKTGGSGFGFGRKRKSRAAP